MPMESQAQFPDATGLGTQFYAIFYAIFDRSLTVSILCNFFPLYTLHRGSLEHFDTLSVYRGSLCEQVAGIRITPSTTRQRLSQHETSNNPEIQPSRCRKTKRSNSLSGFNAPTASCPSSPVKPGKA